MRFEKLVQRAWYEDKLWIKSLAPLSALYKRTAKRRQREALKTQRPPFPTPVVVVGNITVGGTGKTPLIIYLTRRLIEQGLSVGIVSRGYGANPPTTPYLVSKTDDPNIAGDEPLLIAAANGAAVVIDPDRCAAVEVLLELNVDIILSDDGLQHYALPRTYEIAVIDASRGFGNGKLLPAGPLREPIDRLRTVDFVVVNGDVNSFEANIGERLGEAIEIGCGFQLRPKGWTNVASGTRVPLDFIDPTQLCYAVAGIGNPGRFFASLRELGLDIEEHEFPDHHRFDDEDFKFLEGVNNARVLMTAKDALKCRAIAGPDYWSLDVEVQFDRSDQPLIDALVELIS